MGPLDRLIEGFDQALRTVSGVTRPARKSPAEAVAETALDQNERNQSIGLMRVNHTGEVCAQALYEGQATTARDDTTREALLNAAREEADHLAWCRSRVAELGGRTSVLDPAFYVGSWLLGAATGALGDRVSFAFVEATEDEVCQHLDRHLERIAPADERSRAVLATIREDESRHGNEAFERGGLTLPAPVKQAMRLASKVMTETTYRV